MKCSLGKYSALGKLNRAFFFVVSLFSFSVKTFFEKNICGWFAHSGLSLHTRKLTW